MQEYLDVQGVASERIQKVRKSATQRRTSVACAQCKMSKTKCSEFRPCKQCINTGAGPRCVERGFRIPKKIHEYRVFTQNAQHEIQHNVVANEMIPGQAFAYTFENQRQFVHEQTCVDSVPRHNVAVESKQSAFTPFAEKISNRLASKHSLLTESSSTLSNPPLCLTSPPQHLLPGRIRTAEPLHPFRLSSFESNLAIEPSRSVIGMAFDLPSSAATVLPPPPFNFLPPIQHLLPNPVLLPTQHHSLLLPEMAAMLAGAPASDPYPLQPDAIRLLRALVAAAASSQPSPPWPPS
jgi:hypothetical protein